MAVLMPDSQDYRVFRPAVSRDRQGVNVPVYGEDPDWTGEGAARLMPDRTWEVRLDPSAWPLAYGDLVRLPSGNEVLVREAALAPFEDPVGEFAEVRVVVTRCEPRHQAQLPREAP